MAIYFLRKVQLKRDKSTNRGHSKGEYGVVPLMAGQMPVVGQTARNRALGFELGLKETTGPAGGSQHREYWGGPTNDRAAACRRRLRRRVRGGKSRPAPCQIEAHLATSAVFANIAASVISSSLPSPRGVPGHSDRPRRSRPDTSLSLQPPLRCSPG